MAHGFPSLGVVWERDGLTNAQGGGVEPGPG